MTGRKGLHEIQAPANVFIQFACAAGKTVRNNLFSEYLLKNITQVNVDIVEMFQHIIDDVYRESERKQDPFFAYQLQDHEELYLNKVMCGTYKMKNSFFFVSSRYYECETIDFYEKVHMNKCFNFS